VAAQGAAAFPKTRGLVDRWGQISFSARAAVRYRLKLKRLDVRTAGLIWINVDCSWRMAQG